MTWDFQPVEEKETTSMTTPEIVPEHLRELIAKHTNATIERCAQVAESYTGIGSADANIICRTIAAAIRKLKGTP